MNGKEKINLFSFELGKESQDIKILDFIMVLWFWILQFICMRQNQKIRGRVPFSLASLPIFR